MAAEAGMAQPEQRDNGDNNTEPPTSQILTLTQFHAALATALLIATSSHNYHHNHYHHHRQGVTLVNALSYLHFWCATLGFAWWYASQCASFSTAEAGWVRQALLTARAG
ncbi:hypothetical protein N657DRAFT_676748 [Parathielavia appendiculata]|uniref:Uncharacterized protein n=1 Tax=Parathielavia appendiculata TaxID=2587402 RepID=A0AAN6Z909_9PEZI|nr:hypothetical protein N657DRAFT_676748 [Parathielavia appendiculata]